MDTDTITAQATSGRVTFDGQTITIYNLRGHVTVHVSQLLGVELVEPRGFSGKGRLVVNALGAVTSGRGGPNATTVEFGKRSLPEVTAMYQAILGAQQAR